MKISSYCLGLGATAAVLALNLAPARAEFGSTSDNGNTFTSVTDVRGGGLRGSSKPGYPAAVQNAVDGVSQFLNANNAGDPDVFALMNGATLAPGTIAELFVPTGAAPDGATAQSVVPLIMAIQGIRTGNGGIDAAKLNMALPAYNDYVSAMVGEVGAVKALANAPTGQKTLQVLLEQFVEMATKASAGS